MYRVFGTQPNILEVKRRASVAIQKLGSDSPINPPTRAAKSRPVSRLTAETTPRGMATTVAMRVASTASSIVIGRLASMS